jgi:hypothetical protein
LTYFWEVSDPSNEGYTELALDRGFELSPCLTFNLGSKLGHLVKGGDFSACTTRASLDYGFAEQAKVPPFVAGSIALGESVGGSWNGTDNELLAGSMLSLSFKISLESVSDSHSRKWSLFCIFRLGNFTNPTKAAGMLLGSTVLLNRSRLCLLIPFRGVSSSAFCEFRRRVPSLPLAERFHSKWSRGRSSRASSDVIRGTRLAAQMSPALTRSTSAIWMNTSTGPECREITAAVGSASEVCQLSASLGHKSAVSTKQSQTATQRRDGFTW